MAETLEVRPATLTLPADYTRAQEVILANPATSYWLRDAIAESGQRDVLDAASDAEILCALLQQRLRELIPSPAPEL
jgi:hypothetical protein